jgi:hypothetical protein
MALYFFLETAGVSLLAGDKLLKKILAGRFWNFPSFSYAVSLQRLIAHLNEYLSDRLSRKYK